MSRAPGIGPITFVVAAVVVATMAGPRAQSLGTFRWQLQPFCNAVVVSITDRGGVYTVDGVDDQCGAAQRAPLVGTATPNPDGSIGLGLHVVTSPSGRGIDVAARITLATLSGPWSDSAGNSGTFVFNGAGGGALRPLPTVPLAALAPGSVGATAINPTQVQARIGGTCPKGHALTFIEPDGRPHCTRTVQLVDPVASLYSGLTPAIAFTTDGSALVASFEGPQVNRLRVMVCGNAGCTSDVSGHTLDNPGFATGQTPAIAIGSDGLPIIAHQGSDGALYPSLLRFSHCDDVDCHTASSRTIDRALNVSLGAHPALAIGSDGLPIVAAYDSTNNALRVVHCNDRVCATSTVALVDQAIVRPGARSVAIAIGTDGLPFLAYSYDALGALRVAHCGDVRCETGNVYTTADATGGRDVSLAIGGDGLPLVAHQDGAGLRITHCGNVACTAGTTSLTVEPGQGAAGRMPVVVIGRDGLPIVAHQERQQNRLRVTHCADTRCASVVSTDVTDVVGIDGDRMSMALAPDGLPVIASFAFPTVRITRCGSVSCQ